MAPEPTDIELELMTAMVVGLRSQLAPLLVRRMEQRAAAGAMPSDRLTVPQRLALNALGPGALSVSDLAAHTGVAVSSATRMAQRLERMGLVERVSAPAGDDGRRRYIVLTADGREVSGQADAVLTERLRDLLAPLSPERRRDLVSGMGALVEAFQLSERTATGEGASGGHSPAAGTVTPSGATPT